MSLREYDDYAELARQQEEARAKEEGKSLNELSRWPAKWNVAEQPKRVFAPGIKRGGYDA